MSLITLNKISHHYGDKKVLDNISLSLNKDDKIGLIGKNGSGKTTLLQIIAGNLEPSGGEVYRSKGVKIAFLMQDISFKNDDKLYEYIIKSHEQYQDLKKQMAEIEENLSFENNKENLIRLQKIQEQFELIGGYELETKINMVLSSLNFPKDVWYKKLSDFSGGEKTRIQLAKILTEDFDYLLLDEPTNHLDIKMIYWLEKYLRNLNKPFLMISHDRYFLNGTVNKIFHLENAKINIYKGNYSFFEKEYEIIRQNLEKAAKKQTEFIKKTEEFIAKNIAGQKTKQAKSRLKQLENLQKIEVLKNDRDIKLNIKTNDRSGNDVFVLDNVSFSYGNKTILKNINFSIHYKDRVVILGKNGSGKTTLLKLLNSELTPKSGKLKIGSNVKIGYYDQMHINLKSNITVFDTIQELVPFETKGYVLSYLAKYGFRGDDTEKKVNSLSGGEKARLYLAKLIHNHPNVLIFDEPTNHLDISMIKSLENALKDYDGTIIFVSHDITFIKKIANRIFVLDNSFIKEHINDIEEILKFENDKTEPKQSKKNSQKNNRKKRTNPILLEKKHLEIEEKTIKFEIKKKELDTLQDKFSDAEFMKNTKNVIELNAKISALQKEISALEEELDNLETEYLMMLEGEN